FDGGDLDSNARVRRAGDRTTRARDRCRQRARVRWAVARPVADPRGSVRPRGVRARDLLDPFVWLERRLGVRARTALSALRALITGAGGQDGSYLAESLLERGYQVVGVVRDGSRAYPNLAGVRDRLELVEANLLDQIALAQLLSAHRPTEVYNLASPSFVPRSWAHPAETAEFAAVGVTAL